MRRENHRTSTNQGLIYGKNGILTSKPAAYHFQGLWWAVHTQKKSLESLRFLSEEELAHGERSESQPICTVWFQHRVGNDTRTCIHTYNNPHTCQAHKLKGMWIFHKSYSITEQLYWNISTRTHTHTALACCIIDVSHCSPLSTVTP